MGKKNHAGSNSQPLSKMEAVRQILAADSNAKAAQIAAQAKTKYGIVINPKMAATYRYHVLSKQHRKQRKVVRAVQAANPATTDKSEAWMICCGQRENSAGSASTRSCRAF